MTSASGPPSEDQTRWMNRSQLVDVTYEAGLRLNRIKAQYGQASPGQAQLTEERIRRAIGLMARIDELVASTPPEQLDRRLMTLRPEIEEVNNSTVCEKGELDLPVSGMPIKPIRVLGMLIEEGLERLGLRG